MINNKIMASFLVAGITLVGAISPALARDNGANALAMQMYQQTLLNQQAQAAAAQQQVLASQQQQAAAQAAWAASMGLSPNGSGGYVYANGAPYVAGVSGTCAANNYGAYSPFNHGACHSANYGAYSSANYGAYNNIGYPYNNYNNGLGFRLANAERNLNRHLDHWYDRHIQHVGYRYW
jgi:hypothetical protein